MSRLLLEELEDTAPPVDFDPEDDLPVPTKRVDDDDDNDNLHDETNGREHYIEVGPSALRKELDVVTDPKYRGQRVSRKDIDVDVSSDSRTGFDESEGESGSDIEETAHAGPHGRPSSTVDEDESSESDEDDTIQATDAFQDLNSTRNQDIIKGKAVSLQLKLWDMIIDARIRLQKAVIAANRLPDDKVLGAALESDAPRKSVKRLYEEAFGLSDDILKLRKVLLSSNDGIDAAIKGQEVVPLSDSLEDWAAQIDARTEDANVLEQTYHPHLIATLHKWSTKVNAVSPATLLSASASRSSFRQRGAQMKGVADIVEELLRDEKVFGRTRVLRNSAPRIGSNMADEEEGSGSKEVFDDTDFYHQLLRDVVESKKGSNGVPDAIPMRPPKIKKNVDTKASKGRKIRYNVHEKVQNFMVPIPVAKWHEEQIDELFASLLGKGFNGIEGVNDVHDVSEGGSTLLKDGFKLFG